MALSSFWKAVLAAVSACDRAGQAIGQTAPAQPYAGSQARDIKALSPAQIAQLRAGEGMGLALAAELNGYPGPRHVLDLGAELGLTDAQRARFQQLFDAMKRRRCRLGKAHRGRARPQRRLRGPNNHAGAIAGGNRGHRRASGKIARYASQISSRDRCVAHPGSNPPLHRTARLHRRCWRVGRPWRRAAESMHDHMMGTTQHGD